MIDSLVVQAAAVAVGVGLVLGCTLGALSSMFGRG